MRSLAHELLDVYGLDAYGRGWSGFSSTGKESPMRNWRLEMLEHTIAQEVDGTWRVQISCVQGEIVLRNTPGFATEGAAHRYAADTLAHLQALQARYRTEQARRTARQPRHMHA